MHYIKKWIRSLLATTMIAAIALAPAGIVAGCEDDDGPVEEAAERTEDAAEELDDDGPVEDVTEEFDNE
jgi:hypothetical protein